MLILWIQFHLHTHMTKKDVMKIISDIKILLHNTTDETGDSNILKNTNYVSTLIITVHQ